MSLIHDCARYNNLSMLKRVLQKKGKINSVDEDGYTAFFLACYYGYIKIVKYLIKQGCDINYSRNRLRPIHGAANMGHTNVLRILVNNGVNVDSKECGDDRTALHWAVQEGRSKAAEFLIKNGADINKLNGSGETPLRIAIGEGDLNFVKMLCKYKVNINKYPQKAPALVFACVYNRLEIVQYLFKKGAKINLKKKMEKHQYFMRHGTGM